MTRLFTLILLSLVSIVCMAGESPLVAESKALQTEINTKLKKYYASKNDVQKLSEMGAKLDQAAKGDKSLAKDAVAVSALKRKAWASFMESVALDNSLNMSVIASGKDNTTVTFKYALMSKSMVHNLINKQKIDDSARAAGFTKALFTDGHRETYSVDLKQ